MLTDLIYERSVCYADDTSDWSHLPREKLRNRQRCLLAFSCHFVVLIKNQKHRGGSEEDYLLSIESSNIKKPYYEIYLRLRMYLHLCSLPHFKQTLTYLPVWSGSFLLRKLIGSTLHLICSMKCTLSKCQISFFFKMGKKERKICDHYKFTLWSSAASDNIYDHLSVTCIKMPWGSNATVSVCVLPHLYSCSSFSCSKFNLHKGYSNLVFV